LATSISITIILKDARAAGCCTSAEAERFIEQKRKMEAEETARGVKESCQAGLSGKFLQRANNLKGELDSSAQGGVTDIDSGGKDSSSTTAGLAISNTLNNWDVTVFVGANLLSEAVRMLLALSMSITYKSCLLLWDSDTMLFWVIIGYYSGLGPNRQCHE
ncbi:unnamed protein product, partial [Ilex paraguariensis]